MKKIILTILLCGVMVLGLAGCGTKNEFAVGGKSSIQISQNDVTLSIKNGTLTNTGATLILKNDSDIEIQYGNPYKIEIKQDNEWHKINVELNFTLPAYWVKPGESKEIEINWENGYGKLASGEYRILKSISVEKEEGSFENFVVAVEFTIE